MEAITGISITTLNRHLRETESPVDPIIEKLLKKRENSVGALAVQALKKDANKKNIPLPCDMIMVPNPNNPLKKMWVPKPGWKPYDV